jgi:hypothetical protein
MLLFDYISAFLLAIAFTIAFAGIVRGRGYRAWRDMPVTAWLIVIGSWALGTIVIALGAIRAHWLTFAIGAGALGLIAFSGMQRALRQKPRRPALPKRADDTRPAIALYFCITLLLFFSAISVRFYIVNLG